MAWPRYPCQLRQDRVRRANVNGAPGDLLNREQNPAVSAALASGLAEASLCQARRAHQREVVREVDDHFNRAVSEVVAAAVANGLAEISLCRQRRDRDHRANGSGALLTFNRVVSEVVSAALIEAPGKVVARAIVQVVTEAKIEVRGGASSCPGRHDRVRRHPVSSVGSVSRGGRMFRRGRRDESCVSYAAPGCADRGNCCARRAR